MGETGGSKMREKVPESAVTALSVRSYTGSTKVPLQGEINAARSQLVALRGAIELPLSFTGLRGGRSEDDGFDGNRGDSPARLWKKRGRWDGFQISPPGWVFSPNGCSIGEVRRDARRSDVERVCVEIGGVRLFIDV